MEKEVERLKNAVGRSEKELQKILSFAEQKIGNSKAKIFEAQIMILSDNVLFDSIYKRIRKERKNAEFVVHGEITKYQQLMLNSSDEYMRERAHDVEDIKNRIIRNIQEEKLISRFEGGSIVVSQSLTSADTILFSRNEILGYATDMGGVTSHAALLSRSSENSCRRRTEGHDLARAVRIIDDSRRLQRHRHHQPFRSDGPAIQAAKQGDGEVRARPERP